MHNLWQRLAHNGKQFSSRSSSLWHHARRHDIEVSGQKLLDAPALSCQQHQTGHGRSMHISPCASPRRSVGPAPWSLHGWSWLETAKGSLPFFARLPAMADARQTTQLGLPAQGFSPEATPGGRDLYKRVPKATQASSRTTAQPVQHRHLHAARAIETFPAAGNFGLQI